jgi:hypothetical protein
MGTDANRIQSNFCRFTSDMARSRTEIMTPDPNEGPMPTDCADMCPPPGCVVILIPTLLIGGD